MSADQVRVVGHDEVEGQVTSGQFCGTGQQLHASTSWPGSSSPSPPTAPGRARASTPAPTPARGTSCGAYVSFDTDSPDVAKRTVMMKVALSFVSTNDALANLACRGSRLVAPPRGRPGHGPLEQPSSAVSTPPAARRPRSTPSTPRSTTPSSPPTSCRTTTGATRDRTATCATVDAGHGAEYADFSEWDIYRSEVQLISLLSPSASDDMVQSLVDDAGQNGWLPKWAIVGGDESQMNGDSADPIIADAYAMGVRPLRHAGGAARHGQGRHAERDRATGSRSSAST